MCGIIGYVGERRATDVLLRGLKRLEYRGYDSSGVALFDPHGITVRKAAGKISEMERLLTASDLAGTYGGIGHTRWATHGAPNVVNAHPHRVNEIVVVHNGIIENYRQLQAMIFKRGFKPTSETDTELFAFLVQFEMVKGHDFIEAVRRSFSQLEGSSSVVVMHEKHPGIIVGIRNGLPLVAASGGGLSGTMLASDPQPILDYTRDVSFLENGDVVICSHEGLEFLELKSGKCTTRASTALDWTADRLDKNGYPHYMLKEINEQAGTIRDTVAGPETSGALPFSHITGHGYDLLATAQRISIVACGTSWHAALLGKYWLERWSGVPVDVELASEFRYRDQAYVPNQVVLGISQSGETADTLAVLSNAKARGLSTLAITNVRGSTIAREVNDAFFTCAGPEIGVASTKAFTGQLVVLLMLAGRLGWAAAMRDSTGTKMDELMRIYRGLFELPHYLTNSLMEENPVYRATAGAATATHSSKGFFFIGRGYCYPLALEGALKLKEIAYVHAEGYAAGELKHGPIAMLEPSYTVVVLAPRDRWHEKTISNLQEVKARGATIVSIGHADDEDLRSMSNYFIPLAAPVDEALLPLAIAPILQLFAYKIAVIKGTNVDQPRNLAKSVTVE